MRLLNIVLITLKLFSFLWHRNQNKLHTYKVNVLYWWMCCTSLKCNTPCHCLRQRKTKAYCNLSVFDYGTVKVYMKTVILLFWSYLFLISFNVGVLSTCHPPPSVHPSLFVSLPYPPINSLSHLTMHTMTPNTHAKTHTINMLPIKIITDWVKLASFKIPSSSAMDCNYVDRFLLLNFVMGVSFDGLICSRFILKPQ